MVAARRSFDGRTPLAAMARLRDLLADDQGEVRFSLPRVVPSGAIYFRTKKSDLSFALQTVLFDANASLLELTYGAYQSVHGQTRDVECVAVEAEAS